MFERQRRTCPGSARSKCLRQPIMQEIEVAFAVTSHFTIDTEAQCVSFTASYLNRAVGCSRTFNEQVASTCPYHAVIAQLALLCVHFGHPLSDDLPLFPFEHGTLTRLWASSSSATRQRWDDALEQWGMSSRHWRPTTCKSGRRKNYGSSPVQEGPC